MTFRACEMKFITTSNDVPGFSMTRMYLVPCKFFCSQYCLVDDVKKQICQYAQNLNHIHIKLFLPVECSKLLSLSDKYSIQRELVFHTLNFTCSCSRCFFPVRYYNIFQLQYLPHPPSPGTTLFQKLSWNVLHRFMLYVI